MKKSKIRGKTEIGHVALVRFLDLTHKLIFSSGRFFHFFSLVENA